MSETLKKKERREKEFKLVIPLDASGVEDFKPEQAVKVLVQTRDGSFESKVVKLNARGRGSVTFSYSEKPGTLSVILGPENASDEELQGMQTINVDVLAPHWADRATLELPAILIPPFYWHWWLRWCRIFTIRGRVVCPDGRPVPGAEVCAYDIDLWWWWSSRQQVSCATTDATGTFEMKFRWCCGWWPWWWWKYRVWYLEPFLSERILPLLRRLPKLRKIPLPDPRPDLEIFEDLLRGDEFMPDLPQVTMYKTPARAEIESNEGKITIQEVTPKQTMSIDPSVLDGLRERLLKQLPTVPEFESLHLWPWWPWHPWWDCTPDILFQVKQNCTGVDTVIVDESISNIRWNIPTTINVTLVANDQACCIEPQDDPVGVCMVITHACDDPVQYIGGNPTAPPTPAGYRNPGAISYLGDRPFSGVIPIYGLFGDAANVDYYEFEWSDDGGVTWNDMPPAASGVLVRKYWGPALGGGPLWFHPVVFSFTNINGRRVVESHEHFEANNDPGSWGFTRLWTSGRDLLFRWITNNIFTDGTYSLRVKSWNVDSKGNLIYPPRILPLCNTKIDNRIVLAIDNRIVGTGSGHPTTSDHPCGAGTVHVCTTEPDTDILDVRINGASVKPCDIIDATKGGKLEIDFMAHDPDGHLSYYSLIATYAENLFKNLLTLPSTTLLPGPGGAPVPPAVQVGPTYAHARIQGAVAPTWRGGTYTLEISDLKQAFPVSCAYQLELRAYKRTIVNCNDDLPHRNLSEFSLTIQV